ncbi:helix-turn-helix transcriptional regulator [Clostridium beijerinckii]|uniref:helix-turn-helix transcriptional regulator n=1 Tax=Clostridium beijerinckii TaxID=1520 RepID=UPI00047898CE|nr:YafY family protein [Clostridium beijerinckii]
MKIDRLLGIITILLNSEKIKAKYLAEKFEVSIRTIYRDIEDICKAGVPIITFQGGDGGIGIVKEYKLDKSVLTKNELESILIGLKSIQSMFIDKNIDLLLEKLNPKQEDVISVNNIIIDLASFHQASLKEKIEVIRKAINERKELSFRYYSKTGIYERNIEPYLVIFRLSAWNVLGFCEEENDFILFKLTRMTDIILSDTIFNVRDIPEEKLKKKDFFNDRYTVTMLIDRSLEYKLIDYIEFSSYEITNDNRIKIDMPYINYEFIMQLILSFGDKVEVLSPKHVIEDLKIRVENILNKYK